MIRLRRAVRPMADRLLRAVYVRGVRLAFEVGRRRPVRREITLATSHGDALAGNLAAIDAALRATQPTVRLRRLAPGRRTGVRGRVRWLRNAVHAGYRLGSSRLFVVDDYYLPMYLVKPRLGTSFIQVWHACGAFKKFGYSALEKSFGADEEAVARMPIHTNYDLCLVSSMAVAPFYAEAFRQPLEVFTSRFGIPRTDVLFGEAARAAEAEVRRHYAIPGGRRVVLYAPTFRGTSGLRATAPTDLDLTALHERLGADHVVLLRLHPFVRSRLDVPESLRGFVIDVSDHPEMNELMLVSDVLVTDYSSAMYEFALLDRPIAFFAPDHEEYERERGFYLDYRRDLPGPVFEKTPDLAAYLADGEFDLERVRAFRDASFDVADGHATERFIEGVVLPALR